MTQNHEIFDHEETTTINDPSFFSSVPEITLVVPIAAASPTGRTDSLVVPPWCLCTVLPCSCGRIPYYPDETDEADEIEPETQMTDAPPVQPPGEIELFRISGGNGIPPFHNPRDHARRRHRDQEPGAVFQFADGTSMQSSIPESGRRTELGRKAEAWNVARIVDFLARDMEKLPNFGPASIARVQRLTIALVQICLDEDLWGNCPTSDVLVGEIGVAVQAIRNLLFVGVEDDETKGD